jgi:hypothetical protein
MKNVVTKPCAAAVLLFAAGCSAASVPSQSPVANDSAKARAAVLARASFAPHPETAAGSATGTAPWKVGVVYVSPTSSGHTYVYRGAPQVPKWPLYSFSLYPGVENSIQVDAQQNVYFADTYSTWVYEYAPKTNTPIKSFPTAYNPFNIALRGNTLYAFQSMASGGYASVAIFANGSTKQTGQLVDSRIEIPAGLAVDAAGNVFVAYLGSGFSSGIGEFVKGKGSMQVIAGNVLPFALAIDGSGNLLADVADYSKDNFSKILLYPPGKTVAQVLMTNLPWLYQISLTANGKYLYAGDSSGSGYRVYEYPSGKHVYKFSVPGAFRGVAGIAASPALIVGTW